MEPLRLYSSGTLTGCVARSHDHDRECNRCLGDSRGGHLGCSDTILHVSLTTPSLHVTDTFLGSHLSMESSLEYVCRV
jgi:hypothetical protein